MTLLVRSILMIALCFTSSSIYADGTYLLKRCQAAVAFSKQPEKFNRKADMAYCLGLLQGVRETNRMYEDKDKTTAYFCLEGKRLDHTETAKLVVNYLENNPQRLHQNESLLTVQALRQAFPCK